MAELESAKIRTLIARDRLEEAATLLAQGLATHSDRNLQNDVVAVQAELARLGRDVRRRSISRSEFGDARRRSAYDVLEILDSVAETDDALKTQSEPQISVFLSYSHSESEVTQEVKAHLEAHGLSVVIDDTSLAAGGSIRDFICRSIRETSATVCIVSKASLTSTWVALETVLALAEAEIAGRSFIACYLDESFFQPDFHLETISAIDQRVAAIDQERQRHVELRTAAPALEDERTRLLDLRHNLGRILQRLQSSLCLDIRPPAIGGSLDRLVQSLKRLEA